MYIMLKIDTFSEKKIAFVSIDPILNTYIHITKSFLILRCQAIPGPCFEPEKQTKYKFHHSSNLYIFAPIFLPGNSCELHVHAVCLAQCSKIKI